MKLKGAIGNLCNFRATQDIWSKAFINYTMIINNFSRANFLTLSCVLFFFWSKIQNLSKIYKWQNAILPLAIDYHTNITLTNLTDVDAWTLPQFWINQYCALNYIFTAAALLSSHKQLVFSLADEYVNKKKTGEICCNCNTKGCILSNGCFQEHKCSDCNSKKHGANTCTKRKQ